MRSRGSRGSGRKGSRGRSDTRRRECEDGAESEGCGDGRGAASSRDGRGEAWPHPGAFRGRPAHARLQPATLAANSRMLRADGPSRGHVGQPQRQISCWSPRLRSSPAQPRVPRGHHTQYVGRRMAEREAECVNKVFQAQTGKSTIDELGHSETRSSAAPVHPCSRTALKPRFLTSPGSEGTAGPVRTPAAGARAPRRPGGHGGP